MIYATIQIMNIETQYFIKSPSTIYFLMQSGINCFNSSWTELQVISFYFLNSFFNSFILQWNILIKTGS